MKREDQIEENMDVVYAVGKDRLKKKMTSRVHMITAVDFNFPTLFRGKNRALTLVWSSLKTVVTAIREHNYEELFFTTE